MPVDGLALADGHALSGHEVLPFAVIVKLPQVTVAFAQPRVRFR